ncbi:hypothetical protein ES703_29101 [subsurface metagenome]
MVYNPTRGLETDRFDILKKDSSFSLHNLPDEYDLPGPDITLINKKDLFHPGQRYNYPGFIQKERNADHLLPAPGMIAFHIGVLGIL